MLAKVCSAAVNGIDADPVEVEVNAGFGDTIVVIVGLPDAAVKESRDLKAGGASSRCGGGRTPLAPPRWN